MSRRLLSTGVVTRFPDRPDLQPVLDLLPKLAVDGFELSMYCGWDLEDAAQRLSATSLQFVAAHCDKRIGADLVLEPDRGLAAFAANCRLAEAVGAKLVVLHLWELPPGDRELDRNLDVLPSLLDEADGHGLTLAVETLPGTAATPLENIRRAVERDERCRVTLDTEFLAFADQLDAAFEEDWLWETGRVAHVHVKDWGGDLRDRNGLRRYLLPGEGVIDFEHVYGSLAERGYDGAMTLEISALDVEGAVLPERLRAAEQWAGGGGA